MASLIKKPSIIPNFVSMDIGAQWTNFILLRTLGFDATTTNSKLELLVPAGAKGLTVYFQTLMLGPNDQPLTTSAVRATT